MNKKNPYNLIIALFLVSAVGLACFDGREIVRQTAPPATPAPAATQAPTPDDQSEELKEKIEELEKRIEDQQKQTPQPPVIIKQTAPKPRTSTGNAQVNSPGDGFLAMRSAPSAGTGYRILKIPHGSDVLVLDCQGVSVRIGGRTGRWCRVRYAGRTGWAFDGWLVYY